MIIFLITFFFSAHLKKNYVQSLNLVMNSLDLFCCDFFSTRVPYILCSIEMHARVYVMMFGCRKCRKEMEEKKSVIYEWVFEVGINPGGNELFHRGSDHNIYFTWLMFGLLLVASKQSKACD